MMKVPDSNEFNREIVSDSILPWHRHDGRSSTSAHLNPVTIGVLKGEGIGVEIIESTLEVLSAVTDQTGIKFEVQIGGSIGLDAIAQGGKPLSTSVTKFCDDVFERGGVILCGPGGDRFVYDMRRRFDLYCKLNPLVPNPALLSCSRLKSEAVNAVDVLVVRDNAGGIYQGKWCETHDENQKRVCSQEFSYSEDQVQRIVRVAAKVATQRRGKITAIVKPNGVPTISKLWQEVTDSVARQFDISVDYLEVDNAAYQFLRSPARFDVIVTPNLFGDILADLGGLLLGSRGLCFGASFSDRGAAVYQTNHGAAYDLAGKDRANPVAQIRSLAMMLDFSFGLTKEADRIVDAITTVWASGVRTDDLAEPGCRCVGTRELTNLIVDAFVGGS